MGDETQGRTSAGTSKGPAARDKVDLGGQTTYLALLSLESEQNPVLIHKNLIFMLIAATHQETANHWKLLLQ